MARRRKPIDLSQLRREDSQADGFGADVLSSVGEMQRSAKPRRIETIPLSMILPDRFQPRPLLPSWIRGPFFAGRISAYEAARAWLEAAEKDAGIQERVDTLLKMGETFESHGQIKPLTGSWQDLGGQMIFVIETGERRYWASCLAAVQAGVDDEPTLQVVAVAEPARERQVIENQHAESPTAVGRAREIAALLLEAAEVFPSQEYTDDYDYFRSVLGMRHRMKTWERVEEIMGVSRPYMTRLLKVLSLQTHLLEMADNYQVPERVLREILDLPTKQQEDVLRQAIREGMTHEEVQQLGGGNQGGPTAGGTRKRVSEPAQKAARKLKSILRSMNQDFPYEDSVGALADFLVVELNDEEALGLAADVLEDLANQIRMRLD